MSSAAKDKEGAGEAVAADHHFMQNMTLLPSYFTLACQQVTRRLNRVAKCHGSCGFMRVLKWPRADDICLVDFTAFSV